VIIEQFASPVKFCVAGLLSKHANPQTTSNLHCLFNAGNVSNGVEKFESLKSPVNYRRSKRTREMGNVNKMRGCELVMCE